MTHPAPDSERHIYLTYTSLHPAGSYHEKFKMNTWSQGILWPLTPRLLRTCMAVITGRFATSWNSSESMAGLLHLLSACGMTFQWRSRHWKSSCMSTTRKWNGLWQENQEIMAEFLPLLFATNPIMQLCPLSACLRAVDEQATRLPGYQATRWCIDSIWAKGLRGQVGRNA